MNSPAWTGMLPVDDTELYVRDTGGPGQPVVYLNGAYADQSHWKRVIADLGSGYRHITYDERARGKSKAAAAVPVISRLTCPVRFVMATGDSLGSEAGEMEEGRKVLDQVLVANLNVQLSAKVASNHSKILRNDSSAVAQAVRELAVSLGSVQ